MQLDIYISFQLVPSFFPFFVFFFNFLNFILCVCVYVAQVPADYFVFGNQWTKRKCSLHRQYVCFWSWRLRQTAGSDIS